MYYLCGIFNSITILKNIIINPEYEYLREYIENIPEIFEKEGREIYSGRNLIKVLSVDGLDVNVKRYRIPAFINRIIYSFFRASKGRRAFLFPERLILKGFETPIPIAYVENKRYGLISYSYFVSVQSSYQRKLTEFGDAKVEDCADVVIAFAQYTARLHKAGILHLDYSPGNILFDKVGDEFRFSLVDINRMYFGDVNVKTGCANFARLWGQTPFFILLAKQYAHARGVDEEQCVHWVLHYRKKFWMKYKRRHVVWFQLDL